MNKTNKDENNVNQLINSMKHIINAYEKNLSDKEINTEKEIKKPKK